MTIQEIIKRVADKEITVEQAVVIVAKEDLGYAASFYSIADMSEICFYEIQAAWKAHEEAAKVSQSTPSAPATVLTGQLWEPCPHCNREPIYQSTGLCADCS